jgi:hypothetical protein
MTNHFGNLAVDEKIILKYTLNKFDKKTSGGFNWYKIVTSEIVL